MFSWIAAAGVTASTLFATASFAQLGPPICLALGCDISGGGNGGNLPPVPVPEENPIDPYKAVLGKILFWDEQLSSDNSIACGTCHLTERGGADERRGRHPGFDGIFQTPDDVFGSQGVVRRDSNGVPIEDPLFGFDVQVTGRSAPPFFGGLWDPSTFWDGRAEGPFVDPLSGDVVIPQGGALEIQALAPILSDVEMAKEGRTWAEVIAKLEVVPPLALAEQLPPDVAAVLANGATYPDLFERAFENGAIDPVNIAFAIATYERTLVADQTPWDAFIAGDVNAMTPEQIEGWDTFRFSACASCHSPPIFGSGRFNNVGLRAVFEDVGRQGATGNPSDRGRFKVPTLRNSGVRPKFMHTGEIGNVARVVDFYQPSTPHFPDNLDPRVPVFIPLTQRPALVDFLENGLTDPRVESGEFPFDRPTLWMETNLPEPGGTLQLAAGVAALFAIQRARRRRSHARQ